MEKKDLKIAYFSSIYGLLLFFVLVNSFFNRGFEKWTFLYYFTNQSNILVLFFIFGLVITSFNKNSILKFVLNKNFIIAITTYISITFFIVALVLNPIYKGSFNSFSDSDEFFTHNASTIYMWVMLFLVKGTGKTNIKAIILSLIYPLLYVVLNLVVGFTVNFENGNKAFAYDFINPTLYSNIFSFLLVIVGLTLVFGTFTILLTKLKNYIDKTYHLEK